MPYTIWSTYHTWPSMHVVILFASWCQFVSIFKFIRTCVTVHFWMSRLLHNIMLEVNWLSNKKTLGLKWPLRMNWSLLLHLKSIFLDKKLSTFSRMRIFMGDGIVRILHCDVILSCNFHHVTSHIESYALNFHVLVDSTALVSYWSYNDFTSLKFSIPTTFALFISSTNSSYKIKSYHVSDEKKQFLLTDDITSMGLAGSRMALTHWLT